MTESWGKYSEGGGNWKYEIKKTRNKQSLNKKSGFGFIKLLFHLDCEAHTSIVKYKKNHGGVEGLIDLGEDGQSLGDII